MSRYSGLNGSLQLNGSAATCGAMNLGGITTMSFDYEGEVIDATGMESTGNWREWVRGRYRATFEAGGVWEETAGEYPEGLTTGVVRLTEYDTGVYIRMQFGSTGSFGVKTTAGGGCAFITSVDYTEPVEGVMEWTMRGNWNGTAPTIGVSTG